MLPHVAFLFFIQKFMWFKKLWLSKEILERILAKGYENPTPIQEWVIPLLLNWEKDIIWQAQTWTGKTASFALPILENLDWRKKKVQAIILTPTRELAIQVANEIKSFSPKNVKIQLLYWGQSLSKELQWLKNNPQIVVWTPWRMLDHLINRKTLDLSWIRYFVLDEADEMLNMWFIDDIEEILKHTPENKQILLFSATMPKAIKELAKKYLKNYDEVKIERKELTNPNIIQKHFKVSQKNKFDALCRVLETEPDFYGIVFCRTKADVDEVSSKLVQKWYKAEWLHGDISQNLREKTLGRFKNQWIKILVATDVAARWIDINNLTHVINYTLPDNPETYTHRIWRTGRAGKKWEAISFVTPKELRNLAVIEKTIKTKIPQEDLPDVDQLIQSKRNRLKNIVEEKIQQDHLQYEDLANELLKLWKHEKVLAAILEEAYWNEFNQLHYKNIQTEEFGKWEKRLFVAKWRQHGIKKPSDLIRWIENEIWMKLWDVGRIDIKDNFSFINLNESDAEVVINHFKKVNKRRPMITLAKEKSRN